MNIDTRSSHAKQWKHFLSALDTMSFNETVFAVLISNANLHIQRRFISVFRKYIDVCVDRYDSGTIRNPDEQEFFEEARMLKTKIDRLY